MSIIVKLTEKEFISASIVIIFSKLFFRFTIGLILLMEISNTVINFDIVKSNYFEALTSLSFFLIPALIYYFLIKRSYAQTPRVSELIEYQFKQEMLHIKGESFVTQLSWVKIPKVKLTKNWLLIFQNQQTANAIPRNKLTEATIEQLKIILKNNQVKNNLPS